MNDVNTKIQRVVEILTLACDKPQGKRMSKEANTLINQISEQTGIDSGVMLDLCNARAIADYINNKGYRSIDMD